jgi:hypothetical protein
LFSDNEATAGQKRAAMQPNAACFYLGLRRMYGWDWEANGLRSELLPVLRKLREVFLTTFPFSAGPQLPKSALLACSSFLLIGIPSPVNPEGPCLVPFWREFDFKKWEKWI